MRLMFAVLIASFFALLWAALSIARHIRRQEKARAAAVQEATIATPAATEPPAHEIEAAGGH